MTKKSLSKKPELLAPAGGPEQLTAAVLCGADAVYFGAGNFNARRNAKNFDLDSLKQTVDFCHLHGTAVHLTVNTLVFDREIPEAMETVQAACAAGVDALIIQDLGLARLVQQAAPTMPIHASTQMSLHNLDGVALLADFGYSRAVLAREMTADEIKRVCDGTQMEIEAFIHGALCMCLSGQCYLSAIAGERSGNRGLCAQPCRLPFYEKDSTRCGLSLKDVSLIKHLGQMQEMGVCSFKIEGRMKRPEYVAAAVTAAKAALAGENPDMDSLQSVFSRSGFTDGYYTNRMGSGMFGVRQKEDVVAASASLFKNLAQLYAKETGRVGVWMRFCANAGERTSLVLWDADGNRVTVSGEPPQLALHKPTTEELVRQSLEKLGGTPFHLEDAAICLGEGLAIPVSERNRLRREGIEQLSQLRLQGDAIPFALPQREKLPPPDPQKVPALWARLAYPGQLDQKLWERVELVILPLEQGVQLPKTGWEHKIAVQLPPMIFQMESVEPLLDQCVQKGITKAFVGNLGGILPAKRAGMEILGDFGLNVTNVQSLLQLKQMGLSAACLSIEASMTDCVRLPPVLKRGVFAYGRLPLMTVRNCPAAAESGCKGCRGFRVMRDRRQTPFVVDCQNHKDDGKHFGAQIYNHLPLYLADRLVECRGLDFLTLYFTDESPEEAADILREYEQGGKREGITRGLYYRRVK